MAHQRVSQWATGQGGTGWLPLTNKKKQPARQGDFDVGNDKKERAGDSGYR